MLKRIIDCTYKEVKTYYDEHFSDAEVGMLLGAFNKMFLRNEHSWRMRIKIEFPRIFKEDFLNREIDV